MVLSRSSELDAINTMLSAIGVPSEASVTDLNGEAAIAQTVLREVSRAVQSIGWHFNTEVERSYSPSVADGYIELGTNVVRVDQTDGKYTDIDVCQRGARLYDRKANTFVFADAVEVSQVVLLDWLDLPEPARAYIIQRATRIFKDRLRADNRGRQSLPSSEEMAAQATLKQMESDTADHSIFNSQVTYAVIDRESNTFI